MEDRFLTRVRLKNYRNFAACDVEPAPLLFLVGPNGAGKSNFFDALRFVADSLRFSLGNALRERGGVNEIRRPTDVRPAGFGIRLDFDLPEGAGHYAVAIDARRNGGYEIRREDCEVAIRGTLESAFYIVERGRVVRSSLPTAPAADPSRLYLVAVSGASAFRPVYDALSAMGFSDPNPKAIRDLQSPGPRDLLARDGSNVASVLSALEARSPAFKRRIEQYLGAIMPGVTGVNRRTLGPRETVEFRQRVNGATYERRFLASAMSDGALRVLSLLVAVFQHAGSGGAHRRLVGVENPENALHPATAEAVLDALRDGAGHSQIFVATHSPDLLDTDDISEESILAVSSADGESRIGPLDETGREALRDGQFTAGELLRMNQLFPDPARSRFHPSRLRLFDANP